MMVFKNEFSWSKSREGLFKECKRKYFFNHYGSWGGWIASEDDRVKRIYYLKKLNGKEVWAGSQVHGVIEFILKRFRIGEEVGLSYALSILRKRMESDFAMSKLGGYTGFVSKAHRFFEDEYDIEISEETKEGLFKKAELCLRNFYNSDIFMEIRKTSVEDWITLEDFFVGRPTGIRHENVATRPGQKPGGKLHQRSTARGKQHLGISVCLNKLPQVLFERNNTFPI